MMVSVNVPMDWRLSLTHGQNQLFVELRPDRHGRFPYMLHGPAYAVSGTGATIQQAIDDGVAAVRGVAGDRVAHA